MDFYARVCNGKVQEIIEPFFDESGEEVPLRERFTAEFVELLVPYDPENPPPPPPLPPGPSHAELVAAAQAATRIQRQPIISVLDGLQASAIVKGEPELALAIETAKQALRDITDIDLSACVTPEDMRVAVKARYQQVAAALPVEVRIAFSEAVS